jgi:hypothetical protein
VVKFKIGFEVSAETLFGLLSKFLPVDNLVVEELPPIPEKPAQSFLDLVRPVTSAKPVKHHKNKRASRGLNLNQGINRVIMELFADGKAHKGVEFKPLLKSAGFSENSVGSRLQSMREHGIVEQMGDGSWRLRKQKEAVHEPNPTH